LKTGLKTVGTCDYLQGLLVSNNCEPFQCQEFVEELPSKKAFNDANLFANQIYNIQIQTSILEQIIVPSSSVQTFALAAVCRYLPSPEYIHQILKTLFLHPKNKWLTLGQSQSKLWFHERRGRLL
jgi:hypothetical protein